MLDIVLVGILGLSVVAAARNGMTKEVIRLAALVVGLMVAMWGYGLLAEQLSPWIEDARIAAVVAFAALFLGCLFVGVLLSLALAGIWALSGLKWLDMALGAGFGAIRGLLVSAALLLGMVAFQPFADTSGLVADSRIAPWIMNVARTASTIAPGALKEAFQKGASEIEEKWAADAD